MLGEHYANLLAKLSDRALWSINLPETHRQFFAEAGPSSSLQSDKRSASRIRVRTRGIMLYEKQLPAIRRPRRCIGIYTGDFSHNGIGFLSPHQLFPGEIVRLLLPTFWMQINIARSRRLGHQCFEVGASLIHRHDPVEHAFDPLLQAAPATAGEDA